MFNTNLTIRNLNVITTLPTNQESNKFNVIGTPKKTREVKKEPRRVKVGMRLASSVILLKFQTA